MEKQIKMAKIKVKKDGKVHTIRKENRKMTAILFAQITIILATCIWDLRRLSKKEKVDSKYSYA